MRMGVIAILGAAALSASVLGNQPEAREGGRGMPGVRDYEIASGSSSGESDGEIASEWLRASHSARNAATIQTAIEIVQKFVDENGSMAGSKEAEATLARYKKAAATGAVKFQGDWMSQSDKEAVIKGWRKAAQPAIELYKDGKLHEALDAAKGVLEKDKGNVDAMTIAGLSAEKLSLSGPARTYFTTLAAAEDSSPLPENNLGVMAFKQKQYRESLAHFYKAIQIKADHRVVLDDVASALHGYVENKGDTSAMVYVNLKKAFDAAEKKMETTMAEQDMVPSGGTWITQAQADKDKSTLDGLQGQMRGLEDQYQQDQTRITQCERAVAADRAAYDTAMTNVQRIQTEMISARGTGDVVGLQRLRDENLQAASAAQGQGQAAVNQRDQLVAAEQDLVTKRNVLQPKIDQLSPKYPDPTMIDFGDDESADGAATEPAAAPASAK